MRCRRGRGARRARHRGGDALNGPAFLAGVAASAAVYAHGVAGQRWFTAQLRTAALMPTKLWGDADVAWRVFAISWHLVTAVFAVSAVTLFLFAFGAVESSEIARFVAAVHGAFLGIGLGYFRSRLNVLARPFPLLVVACLTAVAVLPWIA